MRRSDGRAGKQTKFEKAAPRKSEENRSANRTSNIASLDNGTMVEVYKYLNYSGLAKNSLVSKRFRNVIQTHRHKLALLYVDCIRMDLMQVMSDPRHGIEVFGTGLFLEKHNAWIIRNGYSKQVSLEDHWFMRGRVYELVALADYNAPIHRRTNTLTRVFRARKELIPESWPSFQHFVCLLSDPFVYIDCMKLTAQRDVLNLLTGAINPDRSRTKCRELTFELRGTALANAQKFISWIKNQICCDQLRFYGTCDNGHWNCDEELIDLLVTGAPCASAICFSASHLSNVLVALVQVFNNMVQ